MKLFKGSTLLMIIATVVTLLLIVLLTLNIVITSSDGSDLPMIILFSSLIIISLLTYILSIIFFWRGRYSKVVNLVNSINSIDSTQEEIFQVGVIMYDDELNITFITPWLLSQGFDGYLGRKVSSLELDLTKSKVQNVSMGTHRWEVNISRKNRTLFFKDITVVDTLKDLIDSQLKAVISIHTTFSKKINFNDSIKADATLAINQAVKNWVVKNGGLLNASLSTEGVVSAVFHWRKGEKDVNNQSILEILKKSAEKIEKDVTISIGVSYGDNDYSYLLDMSLKSLEMSKNRGGDQIVVYNADGEFEYVGFSKQQSVSVSTLSVKRFYSQFLEDISNAKEIFISSHKMADLDAMGSAMGIKALTNMLNLKAYIVLEELDEASKTLYNSLPKEKKEWFIDLNSASKMVTTRSHFIITDTSNIKLSQIDTLLENLKSTNTTIIDHHRVSKDTFELDENRSLIQTATSSSSELVVDILKIHVGMDAQNQLDRQVATALLSGIKLDSEKLTKNVSTNTFETVAFLINNNADIKVSNILFRPPVELIKLEAEALQNIEKTNKKIMFTFIGEDKILKDEQTSIIADKLLSYDGIEASFVLGKIAGNKYKLSARSNGKINVQNIAETLGGGGHFNVAASTWAASKKSFDAVKKEILDELGKIKNG